MRRIRLLREEMRELIWSLLDSGDTLNQEIMPTSRQRFSVKKHGEQRERSLHLGEYSTYVLIMQGTGGAGGAPRNDPRRAGM